MKLRLFYDTSCSRIQAEALLLLADMTAAAAAVLFTAGALAGKARADDIALLVVWAALPRAIAKLFEKTSTTAPSFRALAMLASFVVLAGFLIVTGWGLLHDVVAEREGPEASTLALTFAAWGSGFLVAHARAYRLHDFLLWALVLLGLKHAAAGASICVPLFVGASFFSSALRFQVLDAFRGVRKPRIHLQNARTLALLGTLAAFAVFVGTYVPLHGGLDFGSPRTRTKEGRSLTRLAAAATGAGGAPADDAGASQKSRLSKSLVERVEKNASKSTVGFTYRVALRDLSLARFDPREVQRVKAVGDGANAWRPEPGILWRAVSFTTYDALESTWNEESQYERKRWPSNGVLRLGRRNPGSTEPTVTLEHRFVTPVCRNIVHPYFLVAVATSDFFLYRRTPQDDLFPFPQPVRNARYRSKIAPLAPGLLVPKASASSGPTDPRCLEIPPAGEIGLDLRSFAETIFGAEAASLETRLVELREYFAKSFRYSKNALWRSNRNPLATFLRRERVGNCAYFATSAALLLRAAGVPTRLTAGFFGREWDEAKGEAVIRNQMAHAWIEVQIAPDTWFPVDPTSWAPTDETIEPPADALEAMKEVLRAAARKPETALQEITPPSLPQSTAADLDTLDTTRHVDDLAKESSDQLPEGIVAEGEDGGSWIEFAAETVAPDEADVAAEDLASLDDLDGFSRDVRSLNSLPEFDPAGAVATPPSGDARNADEDAQRIRWALRVALGAIGALVVLLVSITLLRKPADEEARPEESDPSDATAEPALIETVDALDFLDVRDPGQRVIREYHRLQAALEPTRNQRRPHQTPIEHGRSIQPRSQEVDEAFRSLHAVLYRALYGDGTIREADADAAVRCSRMLRRTFG
jgi:transglutaminase-like putative cysteine protease